MAIRPLILARLPVLLPILRITMLDCVSVTALPKILLRTRIVTEVVLQLVIALALLHMPTHQPSHVSVSAIRQSPATWLINGLEGDGYAPTGALLATMLIGRHPPHSVWIDVHPHTMLTIPQALECVFRLVQP